MSLSVIIPFIVMPIETKVQIFNNDGQGYETYTILNFASILFSGIIYFVWTSILLKKHKKKIGNNFSNLDKINLNWLRYLTYGIGTIWLTVAFLSELYIFSSVVMFVLLLSFMGIRQTEIFTSKRDTENINTDEDDNANIQQKKETGKYDKSGLTNELSERIYTQLVSTMKNEAVYKDGNISLNALSALLRTRSNYLSQIINEKTGNNFYRYINNLRIAEFKRLISLPENKDEKILSLAFDCGFNSKSSFHKYFKQSTGQTPTEYLSNHNQLNN
jgi:AraC-like DNA-binding protein